MNDILSNRLQTIRQFAEHNPAWTEPALRWLVFNAPINGLKEACAVVRVGRRVLIDPVAFSEWVQSLNRQGRSSMRHG